MTGNVLFEGHCFEKYKVEVEANITTNKAIIIYNMGFCTGKDLSYQTALDLQKKTLCKRES